jgi:hypothetical protein
MPAPLAMLVRAAVTTVPLTVISLGLLFATIVAILRPTPERERLGRALTSVSSVIVGQKPDS